mmetsp:Transcript_118370/g.329014  ORF Transcript_118370/g.329014 Transcript_118370/m.329014 type:complete len:390 (+) Transcript_118370:125-1294(+)
MRPASSRTSCHSQSSASSTWSSTKSISVCRAWSSHLPGEAAERGWSVPIQRTTPSTLRSATMARSAGEVRSVTCCSAAVDVSSSSAQHTRTTRPAAMRAAWARTPSAGPPRRQESTTSHRPMCTAPAASSARAKPALRDRIVITCTTSASGGRAPARCAAMVASRACSACSSAAAWRPLPAPALALALALLGLALAARLPCPASAGSVTSARSACTAAMRRPTSSSRALASSAAAAAGSAASRASTDSAATCTATGTSALRAAHRAAACFATAGQAAHTGAASFICSSVDTAFHTCSASDTAASLSSAAAEAPRRAALSRTACSSMAAKGRSGASSTKARHGAVADARVPPLAAATATASFSCRTNRPPTNMCLDRVGRAQRSPRLAAA